MASRPHGASRAACSTEIRASARRETADARLLADQLVRWHLWCDRGGHKQLQTQLHNNLRSIRLANVAGYRTPQNRTVDWLLAWGRVIGRVELWKLLAEQGVEHEEVYRVALGGLPKR